MDLIKRLRSASWSAEPAERTDLTSYGGCARCEFVSA